MLPYLTRRRAFTLVELTVVVGAGCTVLALAAVMMPMRGCRCGSRQIMDSSQIRGVVQAMTIWANNNKDSYPLPSAIDIAGDTVADAGRAKDTTANILSLLIWNGSVPTDILVSPAEANKNVQRYANYEFNSPKTAVRPDKAMWDPAFNADITGPKPGGVSYAHLVPSDERLGRWSSTFSATEPILGNRGPEIASVTKQKAPSVVAKVKSPDSYTFLIHGGRTTWEGNIGFNDAHVDFSTTYHDGAFGTYRGSDGATWNDVIFYDEPDDPSKSNAYLGIFTTAGSSAPEFRAIWD